MPKGRKLRSEDLSVTTSPELGGNGTQSVGIVENGQVKKIDLLPFLGKESVGYGEKRFFVAQGKKLIYRYYKVVGKDSEGKPIYRYASGHGVTLTKKSKHLIKMLKEAKIPGAEMIGV